jgi:hypothetical protein
MNTTSIKHRQKMNTGELKLKMSNDCKNISHIHYALLSTMYKAQLSAEGSNEK